jgi:hypothetical protein
VLHLSGVLNVRLGDSGGTWDLPQPLEQHPLGRSSPFAGCAFGALSYRTAEVRSGRSCSKDLTQSIYWPALDEGASVTDLAAGAFGDAPWGRHFAARGGRAKTAAKAAAVRENGKKAGRQIAGPTIIHPFPIRS